jgi:hypothetical protein
MNYTSQAFCDPEKRHLLGNSSTEVSGEAPLQSRTSRDSNVCSSAQDLEVGGGTANTFELFDRLIAEPATQFSSSLTDLRKIDFPVRAAVGITTSSRLQSVNSASPATVDPRQVQRNWAALAVKSWNESQISPIEANVHDYVHAPFVRAAIGASDQPRHVAPVAVGTMLDPGRVLQRRTALAAEFTCESQSISADTGAR